MIKFLDTFKKEIIIITSSNIDNETDTIKEEILKFVKKKENAYFFLSLGNKSYISLMKIAYLVVGNSSSGVLETPSFGTKTINIGDRQNGRILSDNIITSDYDFRSINKAFSKIKKKTNRVSNPFLKKNTPKNIAKKILSFKFDLKKIFFDL